MKNSPHPGGYLHFLFFFLSLSSNLSSLSSLFLRTNKKASLIRWHSGSFVTELVHEKLEDIDLSPSSRAQHRKKELAALTTLLDAESHSHTLSESLVPLGGREERLSQSSSE